MAKLNVPRSPIRTHEGGTAKHINAEQQLRRSVMACMLWEKSFYEDGMDVAKRIQELVPKVSPDSVSAMAVEAREQMKLRHAPLLLVREMARHKSHKHLVGETLARVIQRADEPAEFLSIYWKDGRQPLSAQVKKGLARAFQKFNAYQLAKYNRDGAVKLRDALFLCHAKPKDAEQEAVWKKLVDGTLEAPDTWEVSLSSGADKKETWIRLLSENKLGALALLRNLRNMESAGVPSYLVVRALKEMRVERVLPFRFIAAARYAPRLEPQLESAMLKCLSTHEPLSGHTVLLLDVSGSMEATVSGKSEISRLDAACGVAMLLREVCEEVTVLTFSEKLVVVPARRGFALRDAIVHSQRHSGTPLGVAIRAVYAERGVELNMSSGWGTRYSYNGQGLRPDRLIVITDEQSSDPVPDPIGRGYMINVAAYKNGVGYGPWTHIDGWSEAVVDYVREYEKGGE
jgi:60 kDa SS-A/Ro ribonucleoprotein